MVDISDFIDPGGGDGDGDGGDDADLAALKDCLQALADAVASTNLAVINAVQHEPQGATARVQASVAALKRFHDAFAVLKAAGDEEDEDEEDAEA